MNENADEQVMQQIANAPERVVQSPPLVDVLDAAPSAAFAIAKQSSLPDRDRCIYGVIPIDESRAIADSNSGRVLLAIGTDGAITREEPLPAGAAWIDGDVVYDLAKDGLRLYRLGATAPFAHHVEVGDASEGRVEKHGSRVFVGGERGVDIYEDCGDGELRHHGRVSPTFTAKRRERVKSFTVNGHCLFLACSGDGGAVFDVEDPTRPRAVARFAVEIESDRHHWAHVFSFGSDAAAFCSTHEMTFVTRTGVCLGYATFKQYHVDHPGPGLLRATSGNQCVTFKRTADGVLMESAVDCSEAWPGLDAMMWRGDTLWLVNGEGTVQRTLKLRRLASPQWDGIEKMAAIESRMVEWAKEALAKHDDDVSWICMRRNGGHEFRLIVGPRSAPQSDRPQFIPNDDHHVLVLRQTVGLFGPSKIPAGALNLELDEGDIPAVTDGPNRAKLERDWLRGWEDTMRRTVRTLAAHCPAVEEAFIVRVNNHNDEYEQICQRGA